MTQYIFIFEVGFAQVLKQLRHFFILGNFNIFFLESIKELSEALSRCQVDLLINQLPTCWNILLGT